MFKDVQTIIARSGDTLLKDAIGAGALVLILVVSLHLPVIV
jgi:hypothetical protein